MRLAWNSRSLVRSVVLALFTAWATWVVGAQIFLATPLLKYVINKETPKIHLEYASAWSLWPGTVHARGLVITSQDRAVQWRLGLDEVSATIALGQLPARIFHATRVRAQGVQFALRRRVLREEVVAGVPIIEGLPRLPVKEEGPDDDNPDFRYRIFSVWLENVEGEDVRQIWLDRLRVERAASVSGAFYLKPIRKVLVRPAELQLRGSTVSLGDDRIASRVDGTLRVRMGPFDPRVSKGLALLRALDVDLEGRGEVEGGPANASLHVQAGQVLPGSAFDARFGRFTLGPVGVGSLAVNLTSAPPGEARLAFDARDLRWRASSAEHLRVDLIGATPDLAEPRLPRRALARLTHATVRVAGETVRGDLRLDARVAAQDVSGDADLGGTRLEIARARVVHPDGSSDAQPDWWGRFVFPHAQLRLDAKGGEPVIDASLAAICRDARPIVGLYAERASLPDLVKGAFAMTGLSVRASGAAGHGWTSLRNLEAGGDGASVRATLRNDDGDQRGALQLTVHGASIAIDLDHGGHSIHLITPGDFFEARKQELAREARAPRPLGRRKHGRHVPPVQAAR
ncbi:MAG: hypothetical protein ABR567_00025 [Myxococcales bacterium]